MRSEIANHGTATRDVPRRGRGVGVFDQLVLLIPLAAAIVVTQSFFQNELRVFLIGRPKEDWALEVLDWMPMILLGLFPRYVDLLMPAMLAIRLRRPRPTWRRLSRQPGVVACAAGTAAMAAGCLIVAVRLLFNSPTGPSFDSQGWLTVESRVPVAILASWLLLALSGRWRAEPGWVDRVGRFLGFYWVGVWLFRWYAIVHIWDRL
jgi:hypothetical protein